MDSLPLGAVVPPTASFSFALLYPLCLVFDWSLPEQLPLPLFFCMLLAHVCAWLERWHRGQNVLFDGCLEAWIYDTKDMLALSPECIMKFSHKRVLWTSALLYVACFGALCLFFSFLELGMSVPFFHDLSWVLLYGIGLVGAALALRTRRAYTVLACAMCLALMW